MRVERLIATADSLARVHRDRAEIVPPSLHATSVVLATIALLALAVLDADGVWSWTIAIGYLVKVLALMAATLWLRRLSRGWTEPPAVSPILVWFGVSTFLWDPVSRRLLDHGMPLEMQMMHSLGNIVWGVAAMSLWRRFQSATIVTSLFLALFGGTSGNNFAAQALAGVFAVACVGWLVLAHWEGLRTRLPATSRKSIPRWRVVILSAGLIGGIGLLGVVAANDRSTLVVLDGFLSSSGGHQGSDPFARGGIGNGESLVAGSENTQSFAPIDDAPFMQDDRPSLYDMFDDSYNEPKPVESSDRAVPLSQEDARKASQHVHATSQRAAREFSTLRESSRRPSGKVEDLDSDAVFFVAGRTPAHLRMELYDKFDGTTWYSEELPHFVPELSMKKSQGSDWLSLPDHFKAHEFLTEAETHAIKVVALDSSVIPSPLYLHGVHIGEVSEPGLFEYRQDGIIGMQRERLPELVPIHLATRSVDTADFDRLIFYRSSSVSQTIPEVLRTALLPLAENWTSDTEKGWGQIQSVIEHLRHDYRHVRQATEGDADQPPLLQFLLHDKQGEDYQFATAAALLLRSLGYRTRVVSGFYAAPEEYDSQLRHTPVHESDVHFWTEINVSGNAWVTVEATPGYEVLGPAPGWIDRLWSAIGFVAAAAKRNFSGISASVVMLLVLRRFRYEVRDGLQWALWRVRGKTTVDAWKLIECRCKWAGISVRPGATPRHWLHSLERLNYIPVALSQPFLTHLERDLYSPRCPPIRSASDVSDSLLKTLTLPRLRAISRQLEVAS